MNKKSVKLLSCLLSVLLIAVSCPFVTAFAIPITLEGDGSAENPYLISDASSLSVFSAMWAAGESFSDKLIKLTADVTAQGTWTPVGDEELPFCGTFNGDGHTLNGIGNTDTTVDYSGFFGYTDGAVIKDVTVSGSEINAYSYAGGIAGFAKNSDIAGCKNTVSVYAEKYTGGIAGAAENTEISNCINSGYIGGYEKYTGGIVGSSDSAVQGCTNSGNISGTVYTGGIAGYSSDVISDCRSRGRTEGSRGGTGGIAGMSEGSIALSVNTGAVKGSDRTGGVVGIGYENKINNSYNSAAITASGDYAGGITGYQSFAEIKNCYNAGNLSSSKGYCAGLVGYSFASNVSFCYNAGIVSGVVNGSAALAGFTTDALSNCVYIDSASQSMILSGADSSATCKAMTAAQMCAAENYTDWDFDSTWEINGLHSYSYPVLSAINYHTLSFISTTAPTCTLEGYSTYFCSVCTNTVMKDIVPVIPHSHEITNEVPAGCTTAGGKTLTCTVCGDTYTQELAPEGHQDLNSDFVCDICGETLPGSGDNTGNRTFFQKIADFFNSIINWLKSLFA